MVRIEKMSFDAYSKNNVFIATGERYFERAGYYLERIQADKIHRNRNNLAYCAEHGSRLLGAFLGESKKKYRN